MERAKEQRCNGQCESGKLVVNKWICDHNNLEINCQHLVEEWHPDNPLLMSNYSKGSSKLVKWRCVNNTTCNCLHDWKASISDRTRANPRGCPWCSGNRFCDHTSLSGKCSQIIIDEWHPDNGSMTDYSLNSHSIVKWVCSVSKCDCHVWRASIGSRTGKNSNCPFCANLRLCDHNNLDALHPELRIEFHPDNPKPMKEYSPGSEKSILWRCSNIEKNCGCHVWSARIYSRTGPCCRGCPFCANQRICEHNNLETLFRNLVDEYHPDNPKPMNSFAPHTQTKVRWVCRTNKSHVWNAWIAHRTGPIKSGCPQCTTNGYSVKQINWLSEIETNENICIQHACKPGGEYKLPIVGKVDGYCVTNNTVYEFHGDFWHGNPNKFNRDDMNTVVKKTFGELYDKTIIRDAMITSMGYILVTMWESDYERGVKVPKFDYQIDNIDDNEQKVLDITNDDMIDAVQPYTV